MIYDFAFKYMLISLESLKNVYIYTNLLKKISRYSS